MCGLEGVAWEVYIRRHALVAPRNDHQFWTKNHLPQMRKPAGEEVLKRSSRGNQLRVHDEGDSVVRILVVSSRSR